MSLQTQIIYDCTTGEQRTIQVEVPDPTPEELEELEKQRLIKIQEEIAQRLDLLWRTTTNYQEQFISGAAIGLLTIGVIQQKPISLTIMNWIQTVWAKYYEQKPLVDENYVPFDFSVCGVMPYSVPELQMEVLS